MHHTSAEYPSLAVSMLSGPDSTGLVLHIGMRTPRCFLLACNRKTGFCLFATHHDCRTQCAGPSCRMATGLRAVVVRALFWADHKSDQSCGRTSWIRTLFSNQCKAARRRPRTQGTNSMWATCTVIGRVHGSPRAPSLSGFAFHGL